MHERLSLAVKTLQMQADLNARNVSSFYVYPGSQFAHVSREYVPFTAQAQVEVIY